MPAERVREFLESEGVHYTVHHHPRAVTAQQMAAAEHTSGWHVAKPVLLDVDGDLVMAVIPAPAHVSLNTVRETMGARHTALADEEVFSPHFPDCETGAEPPLGNLYGLRVWIDDRLIHERQLTFAAGSHTESMTVDTQDYLRVVQPSRGALTAMATA